MDPSEPRPTERELFDQALELPAPEVAAFLESACADAALRARVTALVDSVDVAAGVLPDEPSGWASDWAAGGEEPGLVIGRYRLEKIIGQGGFGVVWLAWQREPVERRVALKILKLGLDTRAVVARFAAERQALAMMEHPNVAQVYDAGATPGGRPFFVMEYLPGEPLFAYALAKKLTVARRLELMQQAAAAVQHAHQKGIIHRDLKPSNIIVVEVDGRAVPKIIDFGIARIVSAEPAAELTLAGQCWGTPAYMSPEQLAGGPLDTRTDVYSLGVILFELIAGVPAMQRQPAAPPALPPSRRVTRMAPAEAQTAAEQRSTTPRQLAGLLRGELDWIVMKAAADDPAQRYDSAGALREDLRRFQEGHPVSAGPPSAWYRAGKFIGRNKVWFAAGAAALVAMIAGTVVSLVYARRAGDSEQRMAAALYDARITEARAVRQSGRPGQRLRALASVAAAAQIRPTPELRDEALAAMTLPDVLAVANLDVIPETSPVVDYDFASDLLITGRQDRVEVLRYRLTTGESLGPMPLPLRLTGSFKFCLSHGGGILAFYPKEIIAGTGADLTFYETASGRKLCAVPGADFVGDGCAFLAGGTVAVIPMRAGGLSVVNVATGVEERRIETGGRITRVRADTAGARLLASLSDQRQVLLLDAATGTITRKFSMGSSGIYSDFSPDGRLVGFGDRAGNLRTLDLSSIQAEGSVATADFNGHPNTISSVDFVLSGQFLLSAGWDLTVRLWSPQGQQFLILEAGKVKVAPGGDRFLVWQGKRVQLLDLIPAAECPVISQTPPLQKAWAAFSPDGKSIATKVSGGTLVSSWPAARPVARLEGHHWSLAFDPAGERLYTAGKSGLRVWSMTDMPADGRLRVLTADRSKEMASGIQGQCAVSADGRWLASISTHGSGEFPRTLSVFRLPSGEPATALPWTSAGVESVVFDPAGRWLAASWWRGRGFNIWETASWKPLAHREQEVESIVLAGSADGRYLASCSSSELCLWETSRWQPVLRVPFEPVSAAARPVALSPDGGLLAFESAPSRVRLLVPETGAVVATLTLPFPEAVDHLVFSPDGQTLAAGTRTRTWCFDLPGMREHLRKLGLDFGP